MKNIMKFTKEQVVEKIKGQMGKTQKISDRTLNDAVTNAMSFLPDNSDMELDAFVTKTSPMVLSINENFNKEQSDFVQQYNAAHPAPAPTPTPAPTPATPKEGEEAPAWFKKVVDANEKRMAEQEKAIKDMRFSQQASVLRAGAVAKFKADNKDFLEAFPNISKTMEANSDTFLKDVAETDTSETLQARLSSQLALLRAGAGIDAGWKPGDGGAGGDFGEHGATADDKAVNDALLAVGVPADALKPDAGAK